MEEPGLKPASAEGDRVYELDQAVAVWPMKPCFLSILIQRGAFLATLMASYSTVLSS